MGERLTEAGDEAQAMAMRIAEDWLKRQGRRFTPADVGKKAREILDAMSPAGRSLLKENPNG